MKLIKTTIAASFCFLFFSIALADDCLRAIELYNRATISMDMQGKERLFKEALALSCNDNSVLARIHNNLGDTYENTNRLNLAIVEYQKAIELSPSLPTPYISLGDVHSKMGRHDKAGEYYNKYWNLASFKTRDQLTDTLSLRSAKRAVLILPIPSSDLYFGFNESILTQESRRQLEELLAAISGNELRSYTFELSGHTCDIGTDAYNQGLSERRADSVRKWLVAHGYPANHLKTKGFGKKHPIADNTTNEVKLKGIEAGSLIGAESISINKIQSLLDPSTTLLEYLTVRDRVYAWLVTKDAINVYEMDMGVKKPQPFTVASLIETRANDFLLPNISNKPRKAADLVYCPSEGKKDTTQEERERNRQRFAQSVQDFYKDILSPIEKDIKTENLIIVPHGVLHKVPFAALSDGKQYMADRYALTILPSASVIEYVVKKRKPDKDTILTLANPKTDYLPLDFAEAEGENISSLFPSRELYKLDKATETIARNRSSSFNVIHFASQPSLLLGALCHDRGLEVSGNIGGEILRCGNAIIAATCRSYC